MSSLSTMSTAERERERALSALTTMTGAPGEGASTETGAESSPVLGPGRKSYSSSFGKRYSMVGGVGGTGGSATGSGPASAVGSAGTGGGVTAGGTGGAGTGTPEIKPVRKTFIFCDF